MSTATPDLLYALSLARTALSDPAALPPGQPWADAMIGYDVNAIDEPAAPAQVMYAVSQIDRAIGGLYFEGFDDPAPDAAATLANLRKLVATVADGLDETGLFSEASSAIRESIVHLTDAEELLARAET